MRAKGYRGREDALISFQSIMAELNLDAVTDAWQKDWPLSEASFPADGIAWLTESYLRTQAQWLHMEKDALEALLRTLPRVQASKRLQRLAWHCHWLLTNDAPDSRPRAIQWPVFRKVDQLGPLQMLYAFVVLGALPDARRRFAARNIPESVVVDSFHDLELWMREFRRRSGTWGFGKIAWLCHHIRARLAQLGRLQFLVDSFPFDFHVWAHDRRGEIVMLAPPAARIRRDGQFDGAGGVLDSEAFVTTYVPEADRVTGYPVLPEGRIAASSRTFSRTDWHEILCQNSPAFSVHIPAGAALDTDACRESLRRAEAELPVYFPEVSATCVYSAAWLFDNQLGRYLPPTSNILRFAGLFYLFPVPGATDRPMFDRVFGRNFDRIEDAPQNTSLQKAMVMHIRQGGHWHMGGALRRLWAAR